ncbi:hypothetical protein OEG84_25070 [Hoeflea sp. G2-23]|uniref:Phage tail protein n=1 Tax=Hoeflea algicola TaxID=2983763 RepID=A0ABT3ZGD5_9HYPH|nr:hypothetical protein [Hoeflea algicola]MCY0150880.1 hypothetical protein [Hoeflea algicola]
MAKTLAGSKFYVCATAQNSDLNAAAFAGLVWVEVGNVGKVGETGTNTNRVSYNELGTVVTQKAKGVTNAGDPTIECASNYNDAGQVIMRSIGVPTDKNSYAFKFEKDDAPSGYTNTIHYWRGDCSGPVRPNGEVESFDIEVFTLGLNQVEVTVNPTAL